MAILDDVKTVLNINDTSKDNLLSLYIGDAIILISDYLNIPTTPITKTDHWTGVTTTTEPIDVSATYSNAIRKYCVECFRKKGNEAAKQYAEGNRSGTYKDELSDGVKALLPVPFVSMLTTRKYPYDY